MFRKLAVLSTSLVVLGMAPGALAGSTAPPEGDASERQRTGVIGPVTVSVGGAPVSYNGHAAEFSDRLRYPTIPGNQIGFHVDCEGIREFLDHGTRSRLEPGCWLRRVPTGEIHPAEPDYTLSAPGFGSNVGTAIVAPGVFDLCMNVTIHSGNIPTTGPTVCSRID